MYCLLNHIIPQPQTGNAIDGNFIAALVSLTIFYLLVLNFGQRVWQ
jgi:CBS-domain-containing membrane protein